MKTVATQIGTSSSADFETLEWTFQLNDKMKVRSGKFAIVDERVYSMMVGRLEEIVNNNLMSSDLREDCKSILLRANEDEK